MATESEQKSIDVPQHKRIAMGENIDGTKLEGSESRKSSVPRETHKREGGLSHLKKK
jgi:hypothetical protein